MNLTKMFQLCLAIVFLSIATLQAQHQEIKYGKADDTNLPKWVKLMYMEDADVEKVVEAYDAYYRTNEFVKNQHTQYYKHWIRNLSRDINGVFTNGKKANIQEIRAAERSYLQRSKAAKSQRTPTSQWQSIGPFDYDHDAASRSYAPGSAHVYTVEQSASNNDVLYAGTATAGVWKSLDYGANWTLVTADLLVNGLRALEIDHSNDDIVYFGGAGYIYKTTDGGITWNPTGDAAFQNLNISVNDLLMHPTNANILYACTETGLLRTTDAGANWVTILGGVAQELEFNPANASIIYVVREVGNHTEFYKSIDDGSTWTLKGNGWPVTDAATTLNNVTALEQGATNSDYTSFASNPELGSGSNTDFTIEFRIKTSGWSSDPAIISNKNWNSGWNKGFIIAGNTNGSSWKFNIGDGSSRIDINGGTISDNEWHHLVVTYDADGDKILYQDGDIIDSKDDMITTATNTNLALALMADGNFSNAGLNGLVSEVRIWNTVLAPSEIRNYACSDVTNTHPNFANLLHYWKVDEGAGTTLTDAAGTNNGTINSGAIWSNNNTLDCVATSLDTGENQRRVEISVTPAAPNMIYALASGSVNGGSGLVGIYKSVDAGENWTFECCGTNEGETASASNPNILGYDKQGLSDGGQYYYDLTLCVSPTDADEVQVSGIQRWYSTDGGQTFVCPAKWSEPHNAAYIHADQHDSHYFANGDIWVSGDGGIWYSTDGGLTFEKRTFGIEGTDFWGYGAGFFDGEVMLGGTYHNSTLLKDNDIYNTGWISTAKGGAGGDNVRGFVNPGKPREFYIDAGKGTLSGDRTVPISFSNICEEANASYITGKSSRYAFDPRSYNHIYYGVDSLIVKTEDDGSNCVQLYNFEEGIIVTAIEVAWSNPSILYAATWGSHWGTDKKIWKSTDEGLSWTEITPASSWIAWDIAVDPTNADNIWAARVSQSASSEPADKIWQSTDGGVTWTNITATGLSGEYLTNISYQKGTDGGIYVGTRRAVYYKNNSMSDWALFNAGLPVSTYSTRLVPYYFGGKLRNGTNRSAFEVDFYENSMPLAQISVDKFETFCGRDTFYFVDHSTLNANGASWDWDFTGATYVSATNERTAKVVYGNAGIYDVSLSVSDNFGSDSQTLTNLITVNEGDCVADTIPGNSLYINGTGYANLGRPDALNFDGTKPFTFSAWIKPNSSNMTGYILTKYDRFVTGQYQFGLENGKLMVHREASPWQANGATDILAGRWYYVVGTYDGSQLKVYVDGVEDGSINSTGSISSISRDVLIGARYRSSGVNDHFDGQIDEVAIWNRALSQDEIRELRHLTLDPTQDLTLVAYHQFDETAGLIFDRAGFNNATMEGAATRGNSTCPVGGGWSHRLSVNAAGSYTFGDTGIEIDFANSGNHPSGEVVGFRLNVPPDEVPGTPTLPAEEGYWIINNYGTNANFVALNSITFGNTNVTTLEAENAATLKLFKRESNADLTTWGASIDAADAAIAGSDLDGSITYDVDNGITNFSQFIIQKELCPTHLYVNVDPIDNQVHQASILVSSDGKETTGSNVTFYAGDCINLESGFEIENGAEFLADIQNCTETTNITINDPSSEKISEESGIELELSEHKKGVSSALEYDLLTAGSVSIALQSLDGKHLIRPLTKHKQTKGQQQIILLQEQVPNGLYNVVLEVDGALVARKVLAF